MKRSHLKKTDYIYSKKLSKIELESVLLRNVECKLDHFSLLKNSKLW